MHLHRFVYIRLQQHPRAPLTVWRVGPKACCLGAVSSETSTVFFGETLGLLPCSSRLHRVITRWHQIALLRNQLKSFSVV